MRDRFDSRSASRTLAELGGSASVSVSVGTSPVRSDRNRSPDAAGKLRLHFMRKSARAPEGHPYGMGAGQAFKVSSPKMCT